jgi:hypothetical protein
MRRISLLVPQLLASREVFCSMGLLEPIVRQIRMEERMSVYLAYSKRVPCPVAELATFDLHCFACSFTVGKLICTTLSDVFH